MPANCSSWRMPRLKLRARNAPNVTNAAQWVFTPSLGTRWTICPCWASILGAIIRVTTFHSRYLKNLSILPIEAIRQMRFLITGASGFLGRALVHGLATDGHEVVALMRNTSADDRLKPQMDGVRLLRAADAASAGQAVRETRPDAVIHTACNYGRHGETFAAVAEVNLGFGLAVMEAAIAVGVPRFLNADTVLDRNTNAYSLSKKQFSEWGRWLAEQRRIQFCNLLLQHMYGPFDDASKFSTHVLRSCRMNVEALALTPGQQRRDFIHIDDVVAAYRCVLGAPQSSPWQEIEVGSGDAPTLEAFVHLVHRLTDSRTRLDFGAIPYRNGEGMCCVADTTTLRHLGWRPRYTLEDGLRQTIEEEFPE